MYDSYHSTRTNVTSLESQQRKNNFYYNTHGYFLEQEQSAKYLDITLPSDIKKTQTHTTISSTETVTQSIPFIRRNLKINLN